MSEVLECNKDNMRSWVEALESGDYDQGNGRLCERFSNVNNDENRYCCLGVAAEISGVEYEDDNWYLPEQTQEWLGLFEEENPSLEVKSFAGEFVPVGTVYASPTILNDSYGASFEEIAQVLRKNYGITD